VNNKVTIQVPLKDLQQKLRVQISIIVFESFVENSLFENQGQNLIQPNSEVANILFVMEQSNNYI
jgi:hypothetical protein